MPYGDTKLWGDKTLIFLLVLSYTTLEYLITVQHLIQKYKQRKTLVHKAWKEECVGIIKPIKPE